MDHPCMACCRFPNISGAAASRSEFKCLQNISPFKFLEQKISIPLRVGNNSGLFSFTPIIKRGYVKMTVAASSSAANKGGGMEEEVDNEDISLKLIKRNRNARNLRQKLEAIRDLVAENINNDKLLEALTYSSLYLKWINTGQIPCSESGGPNKCDEIYRHIFCLLERIYSRKDASLEEILVIRKIHPCLASLKAKFSTSVPITRTEDADHQELIQLFNARSLEEQLESVRDSLDQSSVALPRLDIAEDEQITRLMNVLEALDNLRHEIVKALNDNAPDAALAMRQKLRLCEIELEDYSVLLLRRYIDSLEAVGGAQWLAKNIEQKNVGPWNEPLGALIISIHQLGLSGWKPEECRAITNELKAWQEKPPLQTEGGECGTRIWGLRLKATVERAERLTEDYSEALLNTFPQKVEKLGEAFGIPNDSMKTYTEAEIRAGVVFEVSNLCSLLLKAVRKVVGDQGWDILVPGTAFGKLIQVGRIGSIPSSETEPLVVVVDKAEGDEEVEAVEAGIGGVILMQGIPRLSHLVFRAQKENIVVIACEDEEEVFRIQNLKGAFVNLAASSSDGVSLKTCESFTTVPSFSSLPRNMSNADSFESDPDVKATEIYTGVSSNVGAVRIEEAEKLAREAGVKTENICGVKAATCCCLASLAAQSVQARNEFGVSAMFKVPKGAVIPFGSIRGALDRDGAKSSHYWSLVETLDRPTSLDEIRRVVSSLSPSKEAIRVLSDIFSDNQVHLILRPSASVEDLRGLRVGGRDGPIFVASLSDLRDAISNVWGLLYTPEARTSRRVARVDERVADMAVLVQEMLSPDLSFVLHIASPKDKSIMVMGDGTEFKVEMDEDEDLININIEAKKVGEDMIWVEIAPGLRQARVVDTRASPWIFSYDRKNDVVKTFAFANFSEEWVVHSRDGTVVKLIVDYSEKPLTTNPNFSQQISRRLGAIGLFIAKKFTGRWDIEGCLAGDDVYILRMREQPQH